MASSLSSSSPPPSLPKEPSSFSSSSSAAPRSSPPSSPSSSSSSSLPPKTTTTTTTVSPPPPMNPSSLSSPDAAPVGQAATAAAAAASSSSTTAIDDTEDLPDDMVEALLLQQHHNHDYLHQHQQGQQQQQNEANTTTTTNTNNKQEKRFQVQDLLPFPFAPNLRPLTLAEDLESCVALEDAAFANEAHRCSREKFEYRLSTCPELSLGVFCTVAPEKARAAGFEISTLATANPVETGRGDGAVSVLMAHIVATRSSDPVVTDAAMDYPRDFRSRKSTAANAGAGGGSSSSPSSSSGGGGRGRDQQHGDDDRGSNAVGHQESGKTVCIHSLAVHPKLQGCGLGKLIVKAYLQQAKNSELAERVALICQDYLVNYYKRFGFKHLGKSEATFGGGNWHDMVFDLGTRGGSAAPAKKQGKK
ncbi:hypothetical protein F4778DRAFT_359962 [Xylariomycetidae sp. FL2044]|nr:hypothetical protein F4778DRAFT_359962 [Xylariomycetidae sp. FL2044]